MTEYLLASEYGKGDAAVRLTGKRMRARPASVIALLAVPAAISLALATPGAAYANVTVTQVSQDIFTDAQAQHNTEVEPDTFASGSTIVSAFQVGRVFGGGCLRRAA